MRGPERVGSPSLFCSVARGIAVPGGIDCRLRQEKRLRSTIVSCRLGPGVVCRRRLAPPVLPVNRAQGLMGKGEWTHESGPGHDR